MKVKAKICSRCQKPKTLNEYNRNRAATDKLRSECRECRRKYRREHFEEDAARSLRHYYRNRKRVIERATLWNKTHKKRRAEIVRKYHQKRQKEGDGQYALAKKLHMHVIRVLHGGESKKAVSLLGCSSEWFRRHLESLFEPGMSWGNHGVRGWIVDHIKPKISYDLNDLAQQKQCFNYTNLQPLWMKDNIRKGNRYVA